MPLYALERSTVAIEFEPPNAKKVIYCAIKDVIASSRAERFIVASIFAWALSIRNIGMFVALD